MVNLIFKMGGKKVCRPIKNREEYIRVCNTPDNIRNWNLYREKGNDRNKRALVEINYNCQTVEGAALKGNKTVSPFFFYDIDCQDKEECRQIIQKLLSMKDDLRLVEVSESASYGVHAVGLREPGKTILESQVRMSILTQTEMDTNNKENNRVVFHGPINEETTPLLDDALFTESLSDEEAAAEFQRLKEREKQNLEEVPAGAKKANKHYRPWEEEVEKRTGERENGRKRIDSPASKTDLAPSLPRSLAPSKQPDDRIRFIAKGVMKEKNLVEGDFLEEGGRHTSVKMLLSGATQLLKKDEMNGVLAELMPEHWQDENIQQLVEDFYANYTNPSQRLLKYQETLFTQSRRLSEDELKRLNEEGNSLLPLGGDGGGVVPQMPRRLPKLIQLLVSKTPDIYKPAVAHAVFPALGAHLHKTRFRYIDNVEHEATLMNVLMAGTGAGKDCISKPIDYIMADIRRRDEENLAREKAWKQSCNSRGANKDKQQRPEGLVIQEIDADMTGPAFVMRMAEAEEHFLYTKLNEIDQFDALRGNGRSGAQFQIMCLAFDPNNRFGQTRVGVQSVTEKVCIRFNWNAATTINKGKRYFRSVLTDGPISRINFCTIPEREIGAEIPVYGSYDSEFEEELRPYIENLTKAQGSIDCPQARKLAKKLVEENAEFARLSQSRVYENLSFRATVIAWLKACVLYVANGCKWDKTIEEFCRWSLQYDMYCKMEFFGEDIESANNSEESVRRNGPRNLLELLPDEFTLEDAKRVRRQMGKSNDAYRCQKMIDVWIRRGYIKQTSDTCYLKCEDYRK